MIDYFLWNGDPAIFSKGGFYLYWYALMIMLSYIMAIYFMRLLLKQSDKVIIKLELALLMIAGIALCLSNLGEYILDQTPGRSILPISFTPAIRFVGVAQLSMPLGILGIVLGTWLVNKLILHHTFFYVLDRISMVACLVGCLLFTANFFNSEYLGKPTDSTWGTVFIRPISDGLYALHCCMMRNPDGPNPIAKLAIKKGETKQMKGVGQKSIVFDLLFNQEIEERVATEFIIGDVKTYFYEQTKWVKESGTEPIKYALSKSPEGFIKSTISTIGIARHPVTLYFAAICLILFIASFSYLYKDAGSPNSGVLSGLILVFFSGVYFLIASLIDSSTNERIYFGLGLNQWCITLSFMLGIWLIVGNKSKSKLLV